MKILCTAPFFPYPPVDGGRIVAYHHLRGLAARGHELAMIYGYRRPKDVTHVRHLWELGRLLGVTIYKTHPLWSAATAFAKGDSLRIRRHALPEIAYHFREALPGDFDAVLLDSLFTAHLIPHIRRRAPDIPIVLFEHNVESQVFRRMVRTNGSIGWKLLSVWENGKIEAAERAAAHGASRVLTLSEEDAATLLRIAPDANVSVLGPGTETFPGEDIPAPRSADTALFLGSYHWPPNRDGVGWLLRKIWPEVRRRHPGAGLVLAGNDPTGEMAALDDPGAGIDARGFVDDVTATTRQAAVCLVPLRFGGGIRLKILEALANERPVVTTSAGAEGLALRDGEHVLIRDDAAGFAEATAELLSDPEAARRLARAGRARVEATCSWDEVAARLEAAFEEEIRRER